ncbi:type II secretion system protein E [Deinococcus proteolyticus MRP]|uniref:Type II secretion system protein E n=1 Tax=Deinococcus proteolyticus (strain ATCC 35074 / DSM 20540 / JCM 6276 / NBRC 101906 / NCIMB 13154 / VKM Ac-1939 / CCM 2703 / MRP) TaxID=693977 RepID=F0RPC0_DEIPM|nr:type II/IV secretion system protein [Deinococcus proteolyticus]ADY26463.1 type II secretion system protein E [Deinococcus proteolyticus MRP]
MTTLSIADRKLGAVLLDGGYITDEDLQRMLVRHAEVGGRLADVMIDSGVVGEKRLAHAIESSLGIPAIDLMAVEPQPQALATIPGHVAQNAAAVPFALEGDLLKVAMLDPLSTLTIEVLEDETGYDIEPYQAMRSALNWRLAIHYPELGLTPQRPDQAAPGQERLGDYLVRRSIITPQQLEAGLKFQERTGEPLGQVLIGQGALNDEQLYRALANQQGLEFLPDLSTFTVPERVLEVLSRTDAVRYGALPLGQQEEGYEVVGYDPRYFAQVQEQIGQPVQFLMSLPTQVEKAIERFYPAPAPAPFRDEMQSLYAGSGGQAKSLTDVIMEMGFADSEDIQAAMQQQQQGGARLEDTLVQSGKLSPEMLAQSLATQLGYEFIDPAKNPPDSGVSMLVPEATARRYSVVPVRLEGEALVVAMKDPRNVFALDDLRLITGREIVPAVMVEKEITRLIEKYFGSKDMAELNQRLLEESRERQKLQESAGAGDMDTALDDNAVVRTVENLIREAVLQDVSDIHIEPTETELLVRYRIDGALRKHASLPKGSAQALLARIKIMGGLDIAERRVPQDGRVRFRKGAIDIDLRLSTLPTVYGEKAVMRLLQKAENIPEVEQLGFSDHNFRRYLEVIDKPNGIFLVTGPTGSGKSFTSFSTLKRIAKPEKNTTTIEDPVEYEIPGIMQSQVNNAAGMTFAKALRAFLRQDPDIIFVGEIRDGETAKIATEAALTGHLVLATLHTNDAAGAIVRLEEMGVELFNIGAAVIGVLAQRLVRRVCKDCAQPTAADPEVLRRLGLSDADIQGATLMKGAGCPRCGGTGYKGRTGIHELLVIDDTIRRAINSGKTATDIKDIAIEEGDMWTLRTDGIHKALQGITTLEEVLAVTSN